MINNAATRIRTWFTAATAQRSVLTTRRSRRATEEAKTQVSSVLVKILDEEKKMCQKILKDEHCMIDKT